ncbi:MAG: Hsp20/alpha crystallin family protein [bacterium]
MMMMVDSQNYVEPDVCMYIDEQLKDLTIEIVLPDVEKENIKLKINAHRLNVQATSNDRIYLKYTAFCRPVIAEKAKMTYDGELLRIVVPLVR